jgi:hypothetical protein
VASVLAYILTLDEARNKISKCHLQSFDDENELGEGKMRCGRYV